MPLSPSRKCQRKPMVATAALSRPRSVPRGHFVQLNAVLFSFFFFNDTATTEIYTLSLHDALPIWRLPSWASGSRMRAPTRSGRLARSEEHTSELQSRRDLVCRLLLEKKKLTG